MKAKETETGGEPLLTDLINEDMIKDLYEKTKKYEPDSKEKKSRDFYTGSDKPGSAEYDKKRAAYIREVLAPARAHEIL